MASRSLILMSLVLAAGACTSNDPMDWALAECTGEAQDAFEAASPRPDQRGGWQENYIRQCMADRGYEIYE
jgi:hypothetical protein